MNTARKFLLFAVALLAAVLSASAGDSVPDARRAGDGRMMWIPDSLARQVQSVLDGRSTIVRDYSVIDPEERVIFGKDTIPMVIKQRNLGRYERGLFNFLFIPKGVWQVGVTASYGEFSSDDLQLLDVLSDFDFSGHIFSIKPYISYFLKHNMSLGMRLGYSSSRGGLGSMAIDIDEDLNFAISDVLYHDESYTAALFSRQYIGLGRAGRFGIFNEVELSFSSGNSDFQRPFGGKAKNTHTTYMEAGLNFSPGLCVLIMKNVSFNVSFGVFGYYMRNEKQAVDGVREGNRFTSGANFRFNIFNINFGLGVHI